MDHSVSTLQPALTADFRDLEDSETPAALEVSTAKLSDQTNKDPVMNPAIQEWRDSGVDPGIIALNVEIVCGQDAIELTLSNEIVRLQRNTSYATVATAALLKRHENLEDGGWRVTGLDPRNDWDRMEWGQIKPKTPRLNEKGQEIKYESEVGEATRAIYLDVPDYIADRVFAQAGVSPTPEHRSVGFWPCVIAYRLGVVVTEGAKKAGAVLTAGFPAVALPGIWNGRRVDREGKIIYGETLIPDLECISDGRRIVWCFDRDEKPKTRRAVASAIRATSGLFESAGCECVVARWSPELGKGIDDVAVAHGHNQVVSILEKASPINDQAALAEQYKADGSPAGFRVIPGGLDGAAEEQTEPQKRDRLIRKRDVLFGNLKGRLEKDFRLDGIEDGSINYYDGYAPSIPLDCPTILLRGWLGAGKTEAVLRSLLDHQDRQIIWLSNRNGLLRQSADRADRMGHRNIYHYQDDPATHREGLRDGYPGIYTMCPESLKDYATKHVDWSEAILVVDEFASIRKEILKNPAVMPEFQRLLGEAKTAIVVDAFLGRMDADILSKYRGDDRRIYDQTFTPSPKPIKWLEARTANGSIAMSHDGIAYPLVKEWAEKGFKFAIATDSKLLAKALRDYLVDLGIKVALCSSETIDTNKMLLRDPDTHLRDYQVLIYTPSAQNGLDVQTHFDRGLALYQGIISPLDFLQMVGRPRQCDEWFMSAPRRSLEPSGSPSSLSPSKFANWQERMSQTLESMGSIHDPRTDKWALWQASTGQINAAFASEYLRWLLESCFESVEIVEVECDRSQWQNDIGRIKDEEAEKTLEADLSNGQRLITKQKSPSTDAEVWDVKLAEEVSKRPKIWKRLIEQHQDDDQDTGGAIALARLFLSPRIAKLKRWVSATGTHSESDLNSLLGYLRGRFTSYLSPQFREAQYRLMFQNLRLGDLAQIGKPRDEELFEPGERGAVANKTHYRPDSPIIHALWKKFRGDRVLQRMFALVDDLVGFWAAVKRCMGYFGYQSDGQSIRVETPGKLNKNGYDRHGKPRLSESASLHFLGWVVMAHSGSPLFQKNLSLIIETLEEELEFDRQLWAKNRERDEGPPLAA
jgi:hypothetical protein